MAAPGILPDDIRQQMIEQLARLRASNEAGRARSRLRSASGSMARVPGMLDNIPSPHNILQSIIDALSSARTGDTLNEPRPTAFGRDPLAALFGGGDGVPAPTGADDYRNHAGDPNIIDSIANLIANRPKIYAEDYMPGGGAMMGADSGTGAGTGGLPSTVIQQLAQLLSRARVGPTTADAGDVETGEPTDNEAIEGEVVEHDPGSKVHMSTLDDGSENDSDLTQMSIDRSMKEAMADRTKSDMEKSKGMMTTAKARADAGGTPGGKKSGGGDYSTYKVQKGDTLWKISKKLYGRGSRYNEIAKANNISDPDMLDVGHVLILPDQKKPRPRGGGAESDLG